MDHDDLMCSPATGVCVAVGFTRVWVGCTAVSVGVGDTRVLVGATREEVGVGGTRVSVGGTRVAIGVTVGGFAPVVAEGDVAVARTRVAAGETGVLVGKLGRRVAVMVGVPKQPGVPVASAAVLVAAGEGVPVSVRLDVGQTVG